MPTIAFAPVVNIHPPRFRGGFSSLEVISDDARILVKSKLFFRQYHFVTIAEIQYQNPASLHEALHVLNQTLGTLATKEQKKITLLTRSLGPVELGALKDAYGYRNEVPPAIRYSPGSVER